MFARTHLLRARAARCCALASFRPLSAHSRPMTQWSLPPRAPSSASATPFRTLRFSRRRTSATRRPSTCPRSCAARPASRWRRTAASAETLAVHARQHAARVRSCWSTACASRTPASARTAAAAHHARRDRAHRDRARQRLEPLRLERHRRRGAGVHAARHRQPGALRRSDRRMPRHHQAARRLRRRVWRHPLQRLGVAPGYARLLRHRSARRAAANPDDDGYRNESFTAASSHRLDAATRSACALLQHAQPGSTTTSAFTAAHVDPEPRTRTLGMRRPAGRRASSSRGRARVTAGGRARTTAPTLLNGAFSNRSNTRTPPAHVGQRGAHHAGARRVARRARAARADARQRSAFGAARSATSTALPPRLSRPAGQAQRCRSICATTDYSDFGMREAPISSATASTSPRPGASPLSTSTAFRAPTFPDLSASGLRQPDPASRSARSTNEIGRAMGVAGRTACAWSRSTPNTRTRSCSTSYFIPQNVRDAQVERGRRDELQRRARRHRPARLAHLPGSGGAGQHRRHRAAGAAPREDARLASRRSAASARWRVGGEWRYERRAAGPRASPTFDRTRVRARLLGAEPDRALPATARTSHSPRGSRTRSTKTIGWCTASTRRRARACSSARAGSLEPRLVEMPAEQPGGADRPRARGGAFRSSARRRDCPACTARRPGNAAPVRVPDRSDGSGRGNDRFGVGREHALDVHLGAMSAESAKMLRPPQSAMASETNCPPPSVISGRSEIW